MVKVIVMEISEEWNREIKEMTKKGMTVNQIVYNLGQDKNFFYDNGLDYGDSSFKEIEKYIREL